MRWPWVDSLLTRGPGIPGRRDHVFFSTRPANRLGTGRRLVLNLGTAATDRATMRYGGLSRLASELQASTVAAHDALNSINYRMSVL
jgi:hypothetical protein